MILIIDQATCSDWVSLFGYVVEEANVQNQV